MTKRNDCMECGVDPTALEQRLADAVARAEKGEADAAAMREALEFTEPGCIIVCSGCRRCKRKTLALSTPNPGAALITERDNLAARVKELEGAILWSGSNDWTPPDAEGWKRIIAVVRAGRAALAGRVEGESK